MAEVIQSEYINTLRVANKLYQDKKYSEALTKYQHILKNRPELSKTLEINIKLCQSRVIPVRDLSEDKNSELTVANSKNNESGYDLITQYLISDRSVDNKKNLQLLAEINKIHQIKSKPVETKDVSLIPKGWPKDLTLMPLPESTNDFEWMLKYRNNIDNKSNKSISVIIPTYNRSDILSITLACLCNQKTSYKFEVVVADDGSQQDIVAVVRQFENLLDIKYVRQKDYGYQLCAIRNFGIRAARHRWIAILDCDVAPNPNWLQSYCELLSQSENWALIGHREYIDTTGLDYKDFLNNPGKILQLNKIKSNNTEAVKDLDSISVDWRLSEFEKTENLRHSNDPFRFFTGANIAFSRSLLGKSGWFDESFTAWGSEDNEFGYRLYRAGCFFRYVPDAFGYHQEPPGKENETDRAEGKLTTRKKLIDKVPYFYRKPDTLDKAIIHQIPLVSIYIPVYNRSKYIERAINSALNQTIPDLEVCICDDGSTDATAKILQQKYSRHPRVRFIRQENGGIGKASNTAVKLCRGFYIGQLDSDDYLNPDAVELCLKEFRKDKNLVAVYTTNQNIYEQTGEIKPGYNWPVFSREKLINTMIFHHFRMFTARAWNLTAGFDEKIVNSIDYDMFLKISEVGQVKHINYNCYNRVLHDDNTSIVQIKEQKTNHFKVVNNALKRQGIKHFIFKATDDDINSRLGEFESVVR